MACRSALACCDVDEQASSSGAPTALHIEIMLLATSTL
jgi:hypothetical protein